MPERKRVLAVIDLAALRHNIAVLKENQKDKSAGICAVLKADAYGHGAVEIAKMLEGEEEISAYAVATAAEAVQLREEARVKKPVMILGYAFPESDETLFRYDIQPSVFYEETVRSLEETARRLSDGLQKKKLRVHIPVDTGMGRIGVTPDAKGLSFVRRVLESDALIPEGMFTHFAAADEEDASFTAEQLARFKSFLERVRTELHYEVPCIHTDNSAAMLMHRGGCFRMERAGIAMYGMAPTPFVREASAAAGKLSPVLSLYSHVSFVKEVPAGTPVSYGCTFVTKRPSVIATVPVGYADGYPRHLSGTGEVIIRGQRVKVAGRVCMDQFMVDVTDVPGVRAGDRVTLIGADGDTKITAEELGEISGRFHYELLCCINKRVPREYRDGS
ncbi:MAG: alanine racemase [Lachnospiraceae bacterium]|nr:alanine racemase [Lachnospiraceae bacterium]